MYILFPQKKRNGQILVHVDKLNNFQLNNLKDRMKNTLMTLFR